MFLPLLARRSIGGIFKVISLSLSLSLSLKIIDSLKCRRYKNCCSDDFLIFCPAFFLLVLFLLVLFFLVLPSPRIAFRVYALKLDPIHCVRPLLSLLYIYIYLSLFSFCFCSKISLSILSRVSPSLSLSVSLSVAT